MLCAAAAALGHYIIYDKYSAYKKKKILNSNIFGLGIQKRDAGLVMDHIR